MAIPSAPAAASSGASSTKLVPIVLDLAAGSEHFTSELTLANRGTTTASVQLTYTPATSLGASGGGTASLTLSPGQQLVVADAISYLRGMGLPIPTPSTSQGGTLLVSFTGLSSPDAAFVGARTMTPSGSGRAGLAYPGIDLSAAPTGPSYLYGLRSSTTDRSNLALVNAGSSPVTLRVTLFSGAAGDGRSYVLSPDTSLEPGQWTQIGHVLDKAGYTNGYAKVEIVSGTGPYVAYAVFNDFTTNDGSYIPAERSVLPPETRLLPVLVESGSFQSELVLTNPLTVPQTATLSYVESYSPSGGAGGTLTLSFQPGEQKIIPSAIDFLRQNHVAIGPEGAATYAGALAVTFHDGASISAGFAGARTAAPVAGTPPGEYGLFYTGTGPSFAPLVEAWVYGLEQNGGNRSNLAVANFGDAGDPITCRIDVYDGTTRQLAGSTTPAPLAPGGWAQLNGVLAPFGVANGYAHVVKLAGNSRFLAYGVVNDGGAPGQGTSDGSYVAGQPASSAAITAISVCQSGTGPGADCADSHRLVLGPDGNVINENGVHGISDEHASILPPGAAGGNTDYLLFAASGTSVNPDIGVVVLSLGPGPNANGQWNANFAAGYGDYGAQGFGTVFLAPVVQGRCPNAASAAAQDQTFDLGYAAAGSVFVDPTRSPGHLLMLYEGANGCVGTAGGSSPGSAYISAGLATSDDGGRNWPTYRATSTFSFVDLPKASKTQGPGAPFGATGASVCMGNDCTVTPSASDGRYAALTVPTTLDSLMKAAQPISAGLGDSEPAAFVDDVAAGPGSTPWVYALHQFLPGVSPLPDGRSSDLSLARARLNGGASTLAFSKWDGISFETPGIGGVEASLLPDGTFSSCGATGQSRSEASISYVDETRQYLLLFVCSSLGDPAAGPGTGHGSAWFWSTSDDLFDPSRWTTPQEVAGTWQIWDTGTPPGSYGCPSYEGWYPSLMSLGRAPGHISTSGYAFYMWGCLGGSTANPPKRQYSSRRFTISTAAAGKGGAP